MNRYIAGVAKQSKRTRLAFLSLLSELWWHSKQKNVQLRNAVEISVFYTTTLTFSIMQDFLIDRKALILCEGKEETSLTIRNIQMLPSIYLMCCFILHTGQYQAPSPSPNVSNRTTQRRLPIRKEKLNAVKCSQMQSRY